jgi:hypothetical protein
MCLNSKTKLGPEAQVITAPQTGYSFVQPYAEDYSRRLLSSYFGSPGEYEGIISRPRDIPIEQTAGLTPLQIQARQQAGRLGEYQPYLTEAGRLFGRQERALEDAFGYMPGAKAGVEEGMGFQREGSDLARGAGRFSDAAERMIGTGAGTVAGGLSSLGRAEEFAGSATPRFGEAETITRGARFDPSEAERIARGAQFDPAEAAAITRRAGFDPSQAETGLGIAALTGEGATRGFDPRSTSAFYDPFENQVVQQTLEDINRSSAQQDIGLRDRAVSAGAFGGSRGRITQEELARQTGRGAAEAVGALRSQGFGRAQDTARQSFEAQQGRQAQQAGLLSNIAGQLGDLSSRRSASELQRAGQLGDLSSRQAAAELQRSGQLGQLEGQRSAADIQRASQLGQFQGQAADAAARQAQLFSGLGGQRASIGGQQAALGSQMAGLGQQQVQRGQALGGFGTNIMQGGQQLGGLGQLAAGMGGQFGQIGGGLAGLGQQAQGQLGSQINLLNQLGQQGQATQQAGLSRQFAGAQQLAQEPMQRLMQGQQLLAGMPTGQISGGTQGSPYQPQSYQQPSAFSQLLGAAGTAAGAYFGASDVELKTNIKKVGELEPNIGWYTWDWNDKGKAIGAESEPAEGVLAQEVLEVKPDAVMVKDGYYAVDYGRIL